MTVLFVNKNFQINYFNFTLPLFIRGILYPFQNLILRITTTVVKQTIQKQQCQIQFNFQE